jgi:hypothetical protein
MLWSDVGVVANSSSSLWLPDIERLALDNSLVTINKSGRLERRIDFLSSPASILVTGNSLKISCILNSIAFQKYFAKLIIKNDLVGNSKAT